MFGANFLVANPSYAEWRSFEFDPRMEGSLEKVFLLKIITKCFSFIIENEEFFVKGEDPRTPRPIVEVFIRVVNMSSITTRIGGLAGEVAELAKMLGGCR